MKYDGSCTSWTSLIAGVAYTGHTSRQTLRFLYAIYSLCAIGCIFVTSFNSFQNFTSRNVSKNMMIVHFLDLVEVFLVWCIALATLHLNFVNTNQIGQAAAVLEKICLTTPQRRQILKDVKNKGFICDFTTWFFLGAEILIYIKIFSVSIVLNILGPYTATIVTLGVFHDICLTAFKAQLIFKQMNDSIQRGEVNISELSRLRSQHDTICYAIKEISSAYQLIIFITTTFYILEVTFSLYNSLIIIISSFRNRPIVVLISANMSWALLLISNFTFFAWHCEQLAIESRRTKDCLLQLELSTKDKNVLEEIVLFREELFHKKSISIEIGWTFECNMQTLFMLGSMILAYVVITVQFQSMAEQF